MSWRPWVRRLEYPFLWGLARPLRGLRSRDLSRASRSVSRAPSGRFLWSMLSGALLLLSVLLLSPLLLGRSGCPIIGDQAHVVYLRPRSVSQAQFGCSLRNSRTSAT